MDTYDHKAIEGKWQHYWEMKNTFGTPADRNKPKCYVLDMFPYPSGTGLHVGHPKGYVATDAVARAKRMMGYNVLYVMGWDSFGLPCERQAMRENRSPQSVTERNTKTFKQQLQKLGLSYDWQREIATSEPDYYKWTQWIFLKLYEKGLAYQADISVNWCPALGTVLANEEVKDGLYIETQDPVEKRLMWQWMLKITDYAESLLAGLDDLDWPEGIKNMQRHWIGRSEGAEVIFKTTGESPLEIPVFSTRPDTLFGATFLVLAPEHELLPQLSRNEQQAQVVAYQDSATKRSEKERLAESADQKKTGVFTGSYAINPVNGESIPIWTADYVLPGYGTGAIFGCPAHDERDYAFAKTLKLPVREVLSGGDIASAAYTGEGTLVNSDFLNGLNIEEGKKKITQWLMANGCGRSKISYRLRDWLFNRQRYWGEPIPIIYTEDGGIEAVPAEDLPVLLPDLPDYKPAADGQPPLSRNKHWLEVTTASGKKGQREASTMPQWAGSCWYYLRYISPHNAQAAWDAEAENYWMPVDLYVGGAEHATLHLLYARFWHHVLHDLGLVSTREPFQKLFNQGMVHSTSYRDARGKYYIADEVMQDNAGNWQAKAGGMPVVVRKEKMSKSKLNVENPATMCQTYGADALRLYELFMSALEDSGEWNLNGISGCRRFLDRVFRLVADQSGRVTEAPVDNVEVERALHLAISKVRSAVNTLKFNTAIAELMTLMKVMARADKLQKSWLADFVKIMAPFAPHLAEELWQRLGYSDSLAYADFPNFDADKIAGETINIAIQVNGKLRGQIMVPTDATQTDILDLAKVETNVLKFLEGKSIRREIYVPGRLVNLVVG